MKVTVPTVQKLNKVLFFDHQATSKESNLNSGNKDLFLTQRLQNLTIGLQNTSQNTCNIFVQILVGSILKF